jgi:hypothetical protein
MHMQKPSEMHLVRTRMGVDERHHRLQGDEEPEHQGAVDSVGQVSLGKWKKVRCVDTAGSLRRHASVRRYHFVTRNEDYSLTAGHQESSARHELLFHVVWHAPRFFLLVAAC